MVIFVTTPDILLRVKYVGNPSDIALVECLPHFGLEDMRGQKQRLYELPFSSNRKYMAVCVHTGDIEKSETIAKGATEKILQLCDRYYDENGSVKPLTELLRSPFTKSLVRWQEMG